MLHRSYIGSNWCMKEFRDAHAHVADQNRNKFLIPLPVADPGFPVGERGAEQLGRHQPPTWALFGKNVCKNERLGSCVGGGGAGSTPLDPPMSAVW